MNLDDVTIVGNLESASQVVVQQVENQTVGLNTSSIEGSTIVLNNVRMTNLNIEVNKTNFNSIIGIYLINSVNISVQGVSYKLHMYKQSIFVRVHHKQR